MVGRRRTLLIALLAFAAFAFVGAASQDGTSRAVAATPEPPRLVTAPAEEIGFTQAKLVGSINPHGSPTTYYFAWGTSYYSLPNRTPELSAGEGTHSTLFSEVLSGLEGAPAGREYFYQLVATNGGGTSKGSIGHFVTLADKIPPTFNEAAAFKAIQESGSALTTVILPEASDPALPNGHPGSGVANYYLRYSIGSGAPSEWLTNSIPYFQITDSQPAEPLHLEAYATDLVGNRSQTRSATVSVEGPGAEEEFVNTPEGGNCSVGDPCGENAFSRSQEEAEAGASTTVGEDPEFNYGKFQRGSTASAAAGQAVPAATNPGTGTRLCQGKFAHEVANVYFKRGKYGTLYWDFYLTPKAIGILGPEVTTSLTYVAVNGGPINPPYSPHFRVSTYDFHSSMRKYQGLKGNPSGVIKTGDTLRFRWFIESHDGSENAAERDIECIVPSPGVG
jgi:hypothetical protein